MQNLKEMGVNLPKRDVYMETREEEAERIKEEMQRKKYLEDIQRIRRKRGSIPTSPNRNLPREEKGPSRRRSDGHPKRSQKHPRDSHDYGRDLESPQDYYEETYNRSSARPGNSAGRRNQLDSVQKYEDDAGSGMEVTYEYEPEMARKKNLQDRKAEPNSGKLWLDLHPIY